jgi:hypothetical protein
VAVTEANKSISGRAYKSANRHEKELRKKVPVAGYGRNDFLRIGSKNGPTDANVCRASAADPLHTASSGEKETPQLQPQQRCDNRAEYRAEADIHRNPADAAPTAIGEIVPSPSILF